MTTLVWAAAVKKGTKIRTLVSGAAGVGRVRGAAACRPSSGTWASDLSPVPGVTCVHNEFREGEQQPDLTKQVVFFLLFPFFNTFFTED